MRNFHGFRQLLKSTGVTACLPHLDEHELDEAVQELHSLRSGTAALAKRYGVVAFHLGEVHTVPMKEQLTRSELDRLGKVLDTDPPVKWLKRVCCGHFANVFKFKRHTGLTLSNPDLTVCPLCNIYVRCV